MRTFATTAPVTVALAVPAGRVHLAATEHADTTVEVLPANPAKGRDVRTAEETTVTFADGVLRITAPEPTRGTGSLDIAVGLPAGSRVTARTAAAELRTTGHLGDLTFEGAYRHVEIDEADTVHLTATDGDIRVRRLHGDADISTARGDIRVTEAMSGKVVLHTQYGDIEIGTAAEVSATLDAGTGTGRIRNALTNTGSAGLAIRATTGHGDISAR
ncbi:DUF4097 family beta strand repeat-containing protein [Amycolatopsis endophytica]|uniref:DUF4097 domain-containing protein n=1 Tax=Amycolatopsis endophytica TaxID=860233 RepID=A0A853B6T8_9PSEU|nr:DUF4097 family beta strand repeat-containing protein [Amycolatopsis endophytica]NYI90789.1 hypothetical protein [Amycolatopsis endophytica]